MHMDPSHEGDNGQFELSLREQTEVISGAASLEGVQKFNDALRSGKLKDLIPIKVEEHSKFQPEEESPFEHTEAEGRAYFRHDMRNSSDDSSFATEVTPLRGGINYLSIEGNRHVESEVAGERHTNVGAHIDYVSDGYTGEVEMDKAAFVLGHPTQRHIVVTTNSEGDIVDVMPYATFRLSAEFGAPEVLDDDVDAPHTVAAQDQARAHISERYGIKFAHDATPLEFSELHEFVAKLYGISVSELFTKKIDVMATFNNIMNTEDFDRKEPIEGEKTVPVTPLVFKQ